MKTTFLLLIVFFTIISCTREKVTPIDQQCNTTISYINDVKPILDAECVFCHQAVNPSGGYVFDSYSAVAANANAILGSMKASGYQLMPIGGPALPDSTIQKISCWINQGKQDN
jgi:hypothetical protein